MEWGNGRELEDTVPDSRKGKLEVVVSSDMGVKVGTRGCVMKLGRAVVRSKQSLSLQATSALPTIGQRACGACARSVATPGCCPAKEAMFLPERRRETEGREREREGWGMMGDRQVVTRTAAGWRRRGC